MRGITSIAGACVASILITAALAAPAPVRNERRQAQIVGEPVGPEINNANIPGEAVGPVGANGNIYGEGLLGYQGDSATATVVAPGEPYETSSAEDYVGPYTLVAGQEAEPTLGLYLDFTSNPNPQPIRGGNGGTDPGPSKLTHRLFVREYG